LFSVQPLGNANTTGTPTTKTKENITRANNVNWKIDVIILKKFKIVLNIKYNMDKMPSLQGPQKIDVREDTMQFFQHE